jgi:hypothetical protein
LLLAERLEYMGGQQLSPLWAKAQLVGKLLNGLIAALKKKTGHSLSAFPGRWSRIGAAVKIRNIWPKPLGL